MHFWEYMQPGYDALGFISCTGTNFLMRANAFIDVSHASAFLLEEKLVTGSYPSIAGSWQNRFVLLTVGNTWRLFDRGRHKALTRLAFWSQMVSLAQGRQENLGHLP